MAGLRWKKSAMRRKGFMPPAYRIGYRRATNRPRVRSGQCGLAESRKLTVDRRRARRVFALFTTFAALLLYCRVAAIPSFQKGVSRKETGREPETVDQLYLLLSPLSCSIAAKPQWRIGDLNP